MKPRIFHIILLHLLFIPTVIKCSKVEARDEKTYPNGTLVGRYTYVDTYGSKVHVKYFADEKSYSIELRSKMPEDENHETIRNPSLSVEHTTDTEPVDTMVPLKLDFPSIDNIYTIENPPNVTNESNDVVTNKKKYYHSSNENDNQPKDYDDIYDSVLKKTKTYEKDKAIKCRKVIRKIRQTLNVFMKKVPNL